MQIPTGELSVTQSHIDTILTACRQADANTTQPETDLPAMTQALEQLSEVMTRLESDRQAASDSSAADITEIGKYALQLMDALTMAAGDPALSSHLETLASLAINIALWIARHGGQIETLEPVVNALAQFANSSHEPAELAQLSAVINEITAAVSPLVSQDLEKSNPGRPWRLLLLNQSIVATRSHDTALMEAAFSTLTSQLPEDASRFFSEGMEQMEALDYPPQVREVMEKYHREWPLQRALH